MARANRAAIQTGDFHAGNSGELADAAQGYADMADAAATAAETASTAAANADSVTAAARALVMAETERDNAMAAQTGAEGKRDAAMTASEGEIKIVDKTKSVGTTSITIDETSTDSTLNSVRKITGLLKGDNITSDGAEIDGTPANTDVTPNVAAIPGAVARPGLKIGFTYDSADDSARVTLVHSYAGEQTVNAFSDDSGETRSGTRPGT